MPIGQICEMCATSGREPISWKSLKRAAAIRSQTVPKSFFHQDYWYGSWMSQDSLSQRRKGQRVSARRKIGIFVAVINWAVMCVGFHHRLSCRRQFQHTDFFWRNLKKKKQKQKQKRKGQPIGHKNVRCLVYLGDMESAAELFHTRWRTTRDRQSFISSDGLTWKNRKK